MSASAAIVDDPDKRGSTMLGSTGFQPVVAGCKPSLPPARQHERGSVFIITLWVCLGLLSVALVFSHTSFMTYRASGNELAARQADEAIEGAIRYVEYVLSHTTSPGTFPATGDYVAEQVPVGAGTFWLLGRGEDSDNGVTRVYGLVDEASKLNLNTATEDMLGNLPGMTPDFASAIAAWRKPNTSGGVATSDIKGGPFESEDELALVYGADPIAIYSEDTNRNGALDDNENDGNQNDPPDNSDSKLDLGMIDYVTAFSREPTTRADGSARFLVAPRVTQEVLDAIKAAYPAVNLGAAAAGQAYFSPLDFYVKTGMSAADFDLIAGDLSGAITQGLINVNTARENVLRCVPGLDANKAAALVSARLARTGGDGSLSWVKDVLDPATIQIAGPYLTGRSYQVTADIAAVGQNGRGYRRERVVIDLTQATPRVIYRRNLSGFGWALGHDARANLATATSSAPR